DGVNAFIAQVTAEPRQLPVEFGGTAPAPWTTDDSVAVAILELLVEGANGGQEVIGADLLLDLLDRFPEPEARGLFDDLHWIDEGAAPTTIAASDAPALRANRDRIARYAPAPRDPLRRHAPASRPGRPGPPPPVRAGDPAGGGLAPPGARSHGRARRASAVPARPPSAREQRDRGEPRILDHRPSDPPRRPADGTRCAELLLGGGIPRRQLRGGGRDRPRGTGRPDRPWPALRHDAHFRDRRRRGHVRRAPRSCRSGTVSLPGPVEILPAPPGDVRSLGWVVRDARGAAQRSRPRLLRRSGGGRGVQPPGGVPRARARVGCGGAAPRAG